MSISVNTNSGALTALQTLNRTNTALDVTSKRVQTGYRVADAYDDASSFAVAQGLRGDIKAYTAVSQSLAGGVGVGKVALAGATNVSDLIGDMRAKITALSGDNLSADERTTITNDLTAIRSQVDNAIANASYNGVNLLQTASTDRNFLANIDGSTITLRANDVQGAKATFDAALDVSTAAAATTSVSALNAFETAVNRALGNIGADMRSFNSQDNLIQSIVDATEEGLGAIVDADLPRESARLQALQVQQQLAVQSLGIANSQPQILLGLFR